MFYVFYGGRVLLFAVLSLDAMGMGISRPDEKPPKSIGQRNGVLGSLSLLLFGGGLRSPYLGKMGSL